jgi:hypothetical protein
MSLNVTVITHSFAACATDRRLTNGKKVVGERSCKLIQFDCGCAQGLITYNGIGRSAAGETPNDWVSESLKAGNCNLVEFCARLKDIAEPRIRALAPEFAGNPRHTFVLSAFEGGTPVLGMLSNYENLDSDGALTTATDELKVLLKSPQPETPYGAVITGATNIVRTHSKENFLKVLKDKRPEDEVLKSMTKVIRDTAYQDRLRGSVGSSVLTSVLHPFSGFEMGGGVVGGSLIQESPDYLTTGVQYRDIWFAGLQEDQEMPARYKSGVRGLPEMICPNPACGNPVPIGYRKCPTCDMVLA